MIADVPNCRSLLWAGLTGASNRCDSVKHNSLDIIYFYFRLIWLISFVFYFIIISLATSPFLVVPFRRLPRQHVSQKQLYYRLLAFSYLLFIYVYVWVTQQSHILYICISMHMTCQFVGIIRLSMSAQQTNQSFCIFSYPPICLTLLCNHG